MSPASSDRERIVVTGIGLVSPLGADRESGWTSLLAGRSGVKDGLARAPVETPGPRAVGFALRAAREALAQSGRPAEGLGERWGCAVSCSKPILDNGGWEARSAESSLETGDSPAFRIPNSAFRICPPDIVPRAVSRDCGIQGPVVNFSSACATGLQSVMAAAGWIREGRCDAALAGASESSLHPLYLSGFSQLGVLSARGEVRPFDRDRDGFVVGEGAAVFVLESSDSASRRGAVPLGELAGWDFACDAHHATRFNAGGARIAASLSRALDRAGVPAREVDYLNAHGTGTMLNDRLEAEALRRVFAGGRAPKVSSTKGATGHLLGATGAAELAFCFLALRDGRLPPTLHLENPESADFDFLPKSSRACDARTAATLSFGFGGSIAALVAARFP